jgi:hypothetical protein
MVGAVLVGVRSQPVEKDVRLVVDTKLRQHLTNLYKAEMDVPSAGTYSL